MSGAVGTDADSVAVCHKLWTEKVFAFADPSQKNNCGNFSPPEVCMEVPIIPNVFQVRKSTHKPTCSTDVASNTVDGNKNWSQMFETAENHKQACMANTTIQAMVSLQKFAALSVIWQQQIWHLPQEWCTMKPASKSNLRKPTRKKKKKKTKRSRC